MSQPIARRQFLSRSTAAGLGAFFIASRLPGQIKSPNERLNIGIVGVANRGRGNLDAVKGENIVALCDTDDLYLAKASDEFPQAQIFNDLRELINLPELDAIVVSTTDHTHAIATLRALRRGLHVYCEKPLTHTVQEARVVAEAAKKGGTATQLGTQIHAGKNYRRVVELVQSGAIGAIGAVRECHVWVGAQWGGGDRPTETPEVPKHIHWDLWLGPAPERPYHPSYVPSNWRRWWDFGGGSLADMGCHYMDLAFWALKLRHPLAIEAEGPPVHPESCPMHLTVRYEFPARDSMPPVTLTWYDGGRKPEALLTEHNLGKKGAGVLFIGEKGTLFADYNQRRLLPAEQFEGFEAPPPTIPDSIGHHAEWIQACKTGSPTSCNFDYGGALTENVLLGNVAFRSGKRIEWDAANLRITNEPDAMRFLRKSYRQGWEL